MSPWTMLSITSRPSELFLRVDPNDLSWRTSSSNISPKISEGVPTMGSIHEERFEFFSVGRRNRRQRRDSRFRDRLWGLGFVRLESLR
ncbi:hypothetical protein Lal_00040208 [Lupinus albus]|nr:hypothetical protein Lal_00040208 [Lupinus albus]